MAHPTVAEQLVGMVRDAGARRIYGVAGDSLNPVVDVVRRNEGIDWVHVSHEEGDAFAAAAEAQLTGRLAVCAGSSGPGTTHLLQGLYDAQRSGAPVLAIASHIQSSEIGTGFFQETHPTHVFQDCSVWCELVTPAQMPQAVRVAIQTAVGRRGVADLLSRVRMKRVAPRTPPTGKLPQHYVTGHAPSASGATDSPCCLSAGPPRESTRTAGGRPRQDGSGWRSPTWPRRR